MIPNELLDELTAQQRLAISRRALVRHLRGNDDNDAADNPPDIASTSVPRAGPNGPSGMLSSLLKRTPYGVMARNLTDRWWSRHPVNAAVQLARPLLNTCAREQPIKLIAASAAMGALIVLVKPWKLLSITAMLAALLKTSDMADLVTTLMQPTGDSRH